MMKNTFLVTTIMFLSLSLGAQSNWGKLSLIRFELKEDIYGELDYTPGKFTEMIEQLDGTEMELEGYIVPLEGEKKQKHLFFSLYPYANCFFCGNAGSETVIEVMMGDDQYLEYTDEQIKLTGVFKFIPGDMKSVMYKLEQAKLVE
jgi:hypothetical protein